MLGTILILAAGLGILTHSVYWGLFGAVVLFLSLEGFYFPTRYELDDRGVTVVRGMSRSERSWESVRRVIEDRAGLTLSPYRGRRFMEPFRAIRLLFDGGDRARIVERVRRSLAPAVTADSAEPAGDAASGERPATVDWVTLS